MKLVKGVKDWRTAEIREWETESVCVRLEDLVKRFQAFDLSIWDWESERERENVWDLRVEYVSETKSERYEIEIRDREREWGLRLWAEAVDLVREWLGEDWREIEAVDLDLDSVKTEECERESLRFDISNQIFHL